ncbi:hypothetical protein DAPPUDRAFT_229381 [Daphnia pulex]|uniref:Major facilitator superfamily (MFS) profile domain-containing protein n=1 Tax=Daphnia pulex TaxID=6669 RepID=E9HNW1_DAPPU|nr:hypothetical protein DAPPUDRAFT_229381 [Daphnia pulex]|eukprot:EFX66569.1 hypothetical protein DAPPUDRAFT_229381 [Daphnia pulex]
MDSSGIRANMSAQQLIDHEVYERSLRNPNSRQDGKVSTDSSGSSSLSSSNTKIDGKGIPSASDSSANSSSGENRTVEHPLTKRHIITVTILCFVNLINYMDRYTIAGFCLSSHLFEQNANPIIYVVCDLFLVNLSSILIASFRLLACTGVSDVVVMWEWPVLEKFPSFHVLALIFSREGSVTSDGVVLVLLPIGSQLTAETSSGLSGCRSACLRSGPIVKRTLHGGHLDSGFSVSYIFGLIAMIAGLLGVPLGSFLGQKLRVRYQRADPIVCGMGMLFSTPLMLAALFIAGWNTTTCFVVVFFGQVLLNLNWAIVADILLYTVIPTRRSTAEAFQILFSHALGDAGSPYLIGQISEILKKSFSTPAAFVEGAMVLNSTVSSIVSDFVTSSPDMNVSANCSSSGTSSIDLTTVEGDFKALQWAMSITIVVEVLGALFFFGTAWYIVEDKAKVDRAVAGVHLSGLKGFIVLRCHIATESKEDRRLFKVHESRAGVSQHALRQDVEQQTNLPFPGASGISNEIAVVQPGSSSDAGLEGRAYINQAMEE